MIVLAVLVSVVINNLLIIYGIFLVWNTVREGEKREKRERETWIAFSRLMSDTLVSLVQWQELTADMMQRDSDNLLSHDHHVLELLEATNQLKDKLSRLSDPVP